VREGALWAKVGDACQPVAIDDAATGKLEITTCVQDDVTCGVTITATGEATLDRAWCRRGRDLVTGFVNDDRLRLLGATEDHVAYVHLVDLVVSAHTRTELQQCTPASVRTLKRQTELAEGLERVHEGLRVCTIVEGFGVSPMPHRATPEEGTLRREAESGPRLGSVPPDQPPPPVVDCTLPCSTPSVDELRAAAQAEVEGRAYVPPEPRGIDLFRTPAACASATETRPTVLPADLCTTLGARLR
jgi:hypothetical protein